MKEVFLFATDISLLTMSQKDYEKAVKAVSKLPGLFGVHPDVAYVLIMFDKVEDAITARGIWTEKGYNAGRYIMSGRIEDDGLTITVDKPVHDCSGGPVQ